VGYLGYGLRAGVEGFKSGFNMGQMKWQQNEKKRLEKKQEELNQAATVFNQMVNQMGEDGAYSEDDIMKINTAYMALGYQAKEMVDGTYKAIQTMDKKTIEENYKVFDYVIETTNDMKSADAQVIFDTFRPFVTGEKGLQMYEAYESISKKKSEIGQAPKEYDPLDVYKATPSANMPYGMTEQMGSMAGFNMPGEMPTAPTSTQPQTELDKQAETDKWLDSAYKSGNANYFNQIAKQRGSPATFDTYKQGYEKPAGAGGVAPKAVDPNDVLFGTNGIMKDYINSGSQLGEQQKTEIRNNYNIIKPSLSAEVRTQVEDYLQQIGIDLNPPTEAPIPEPTPEAPQPNLLQKGANAVKNWLGQKGTPKPTDYATMTEEVLFKLASEGDQLAYEEAKRRGII